MVRLELFSSKFRVKLLVGLLVGMVRVLVMTFVMYVSIKYMNVRMCVCVCLLSLHTIPPYYKS